MSDLRFDSIVMAIQAEFLQAQLKYKPFNSLHEGTAIVLEEYEELWDLVKVKQGRRDWEKLEYEAQQLAAMTIRLIYDVIIPQKESLKNDR